MASAQRSVIRLYLALIAISLFLTASLVALVGVFGSAERYAGLIVTIDTVIRLVFFVLVALEGGRLARAVEGERALVYQILFWIPCLNIFPLLILSSRSNRIMKENGIKVGFLGVNPASIP
jgi:hypothetical protein